MCSWDGLEIGWDRLALAWANSLEVITWSQRPVTVHLQSSQGGGQGETEVHNLITWKVFVLSRDRNRVLKNQILKWCWKLSYPEKILLIS